MTDKDGYCSFCKLNARKLAEQNAGLKLQVARMARMNQAVLSVVKLYEESQFLPPEVKAAAAGIIGSFNDREASRKLKAKLMDIVPPEGG